MAKRGSRFERREVAVGATSAYEAVVTNGLTEGAVIARNAAAYVDKSRTQAK
jgi:hypothetical protein